MRVRWTIVVEGATLEAMRSKADRAFSDWIGDLHYRLPLEPIFLDAELDEDDPGSYRAWASRNFEVVDR